MDLKEEVFNFCKQFKTFTTRQVIDKFIEEQPHILRKCIAELKDEKRVFMHGNKKGAYYSFSESEEIEAKVIEDTSLQDKLSIDIYEFIKNNGEHTTTSEIIQKFSNIKEYLIKQEIQVLRNTEKIFMHGNKRGAYYNLNKEEETKIKSNESSDDNETLIFNYFINNKKWITKKEVADALKLDEVIVKNTIRKLVDDYAVSMRGSFRWAEYCHADYEEDLEDELGEGEASSELEEKISTYFRTNLAANVPQLMEHFDVSRFEITKVLKNLIEQEFIYKDGVKKSTKYILMNADYNDALNKFENIKEETSKVFNSELEKLLNSEKYLCIRYKDMKFTLIKKCLSFANYFSEEEKLSTSKELSMRLKEMVE